MKTTYRKRTELEPEMIVNKDGRTVETVQHYEHRTLVLYKDHSWEYLYGEAYLPIDVPEWTDLTNKVVDAIGAPFAPGFQIDREFVEPIWINAVGSGEDWYAEFNVAHGMDRGLTEEQTWRLHQICINRCIGALEVLFFGEAQPREYI